MTIIQIGSHIGFTENDFIKDLIDEKTDLILIEPVPHLFLKLKDNYNIKYPNNNFIFLNIAISDSELTKKVKFHTPSEKNDFNKLPSWVSQISSFDIEHIYKHKYIDPDTNEIIILKDILIIEEIEVETKTLCQIITENNVTKIDILNVDTEGYDYNILKSYDFKVKPNKIIFEHAHIKTIELYNELIEYIKNFGYRVTDILRDDTILDKIS